MEPLYCNNVDQLNELALFAGAGGGLWGSKLIGLRTVCAVEINRYAASVLCARQNDGSLEPFPIWDDVCTFDGKRWRGIVDVISGGFPCQDISPIGSRLGIANGKKSKLWDQYSRIIRDILPRYIFAENSPAITIRGLDCVLSDLAALGYNAKWGVFSACSVGAPHVRERMFIFAYPVEPGQKSREDEARRCSTDRQWFSAVPGRFFKTQNNKHWIQQNVETKPFICGVDDGMAARQHRIAATGNGQVPAVVKLAWDTLTDGVI